MAVLNDKNKKEENKTNNLNNTSSATTDSSLKGVDQGTVAKMNSTYTPSNEQIGAQAEADDARQNLKEVTSNKQIISNDVMNTLNSQFVVPESVTKADTYLNSKLESIQSGKTSFSDQVRDMMSQIQGREKFSYDVNTDPLFQQALSSAMNSGKTAMQDTMGQASALTGGYGSTYATTAGNQAYNAFIEDAYNNLPQYYQMAMEAYQMEGDEMYRQLDMLNSADDKEYNRNLTAYDTTFSYRNRMYDESYTQFRDNKSDAFNMANLQLAEHGQQVSDASTYYNATSDYANTMYNRDYTKWADEVTQATQYAQLLNSNYWSQQDMDYKNATFDESKRQFNYSVGDTNNDGVVSDEEYAKLNEWNQKELDYKYASLNESKRQFNYGIGDTNNDGVVSDEEYAKFLEMSGKSGNNGSKLSAGIIGRLESVKSNAELATYVASLGLDEEESKALIAEYSLVPLNQRQWTMTYDGGGNKKDSIDEDARVKDQYGNEIRLDDLRDDIALELIAGIDNPTEEQKVKAYKEATDYVKKLQRNKGITKQ